MGKEMEDIGSLPLHTAWVQVNEIRGGISPMGDVWSWNSGSLNPTSFPNVLELARWIEFSVFLPRWRLDKRAHIFSDMLSGECFLELTIEINPRKRTCKFFWQYSFWNANYAYAAEEHQIAMWEVSRWIFCNCQPSDLFMFTWAFRTWSDKKTNHVTTVRKYKIISGVSLAVIEDH